MARFTSTSQLNIRWRGIWEFSGAAGTQFSLPDSLYDEFNGEMSGLIPGLTWVSTQDEATIPVAQSDVTGLTSALAGKFDKTGGTISGAVTATGAISGASVSATGAINGASVSAASMTANSHRTKGEPVYNVKAYGAVGDGSTDDTTAIQNAIAAASASVGGTVYFPAGTYKVTSALAPSIHLSLRGDGPDTSIINCTQTSGFGIKYTGVTTSPESNWGRYFTVEKLQVQHAGSSAALAFYYCLNFSVNDVMVKALGATGDGVEIIDSYVISLENLRSHSFASGSGIVLRSTGVTNPGQLLLKNCQSRFNANGLLFDAQAGVIDTCTVDTFIATDNSSTGVTLQGSGGNRVLSFRDLHIEHSSTTNACTGFWQTGTDCTSLGIDGVFVWGVKTPFNFAGTASGVRLDRVYLNTNGHGSPGTAITASSNISRFHVGNIVNSGVNPYSTMFSDSSDSATKRYLFAGAKPSVASASSNLALTTTATDIPGCSITVTPTFPETWLVIGTFAMNVTSAGVGVEHGFIVYDGSIVGPTAFFDPNGGTGSISMSLAWVITGVTAGSSHTVKLQANKGNSGGTGNAVSAHNVLTLHRLSG